MSRADVPPGYPSDWHKRRRRVYKRDEYECRNCGAGGGRKGDNELHAHHIVPISDGGTHRMSNLATLCKDCHESIHENTSDRRSANICVECGGKAPSVGKERCYSCRQASQPANDSGQQTPNSEKSTESGEHQVTTESESETHSDTIDSSTLKPCKKCESMIDSNSYVCPECDYNPTGAGEMVFAVITIVLGVTTIGVLNLFIDSVLMIFIIMFFALFVYTFVMVGMMMAAGIFKTATKDVSDD